MSKKLRQAQWRLADNGIHYWWNGKNFDNISPPNNDPAAPAGWYEWSATLQRWWSARHQWEEAYRTGTGKIDVANNIGQTMLHLGPMEHQGMPRQALMNELKKYPPCEIVSSNIIKSPVAISYDVFAVIKWD